MPGVKVKVNFRVGWTDGITEGQKIEEGVNQASVYINI
jgi:hypothetical protein